MYKTWENVGIEWVVHQMVLVFVKMEQILTILWKLNKLWLCTQELFGYSDKVIEYLVQVTMLFKAQMWGFSIKMDRKGFFGGGGVGEENKK